VRLGSVERWDGGVAASRLSDSDRATVRETESPLVGEERTYMNAKAGKKRRSRSQVSSPRQASVVGCLQG
jgi:hypothetical protein